MKKIKLGVLCVDVKDKSNIFSFTSNCAFHILNELKKYDDIEIVKHYVSSTSDTKELWLKDLSKVDHLFGINLRQWSYYPSDKVAIIKSKIKGKLFQFYDSGSRREPTDINFSFLDQGIIKNKTYEDVYVGWSADPDTFYINKSKDDKTLNILIDHSHFSANKTEGYEMSDEIATQCNMFANSTQMLEIFNRNNNTTFTSVKVRRLVSGGVEDLDLTNKVNLNYSHTSVGQQHLADEYAKAHIFIATHKESLGMCILESAMSGCFVISPKGFIKEHQVLQHVNNYTFKTNIEWQNIVNAINPTENRDNVVHWSWERSVNIMYNTIKRYDNEIN